MATNVDSDQLKGIVFTERRPVMVLFTGPWCVDCMAFKPTWEMWCSTWNKPVHVMEIKRGDSAWTEWNIREIPTVAVYVDGVEIDKASDKISSEDLDRLWLVIGSR